MMLEGKKWISSRGGRQEALDLFPEEKLVSASEIFESISQISHDGAYRLLEKVYQRIGFGEIPDKILKDLTIARICEPSSKLATVDYIRRYWNEDYHYQQVYRYLDTLYNTQKEIVQSISVRHTEEVLGGAVRLAFYDVTTLYFESFKEDNLRSPGFSKDGKTTETQVVLGLLVSQDGYPLAYSLFNGSQFEGYTMLPILDDFIQRYGIKDFVLVADSGLMSNKNLELLREAKYKYIIGARIRKESLRLRNWILSLKKENVAVYEERKPDGGRLLVSYSSKRSQKDAFNRDKGVKRLQKSFASGKLTKDKINKRGYNKFLSISKDVEVTIDPHKIEEDAGWDGWKGYLTNTTLPPEECIGQYHGLWVVERAFRISKGTLDMRPMFHFTERRIEAHVCICFVALKVYKELERLLRIKQCKISVDEVIKIAKTILSVTICIGNEAPMTKTLYLTPEQKSLIPIFEALGL